MEDIINTFIQTGYTLAQCINEFVIDRAILQDEDIQTSLRAMFRTRSILYAFETFGKLDPIRRDNQDLLPKDIGVAIVRFEMAQIQKRVPDIRYDIRCMIRPVNAPIPSVIIPRKLFDTLNNDFAYLDKTHLANAHSNECNECKYVESMNHLIYKWNDSLLPNFNSMREHKILNPDFFEKYFQPLSYVGRTIFQVKMDEYGEMPIEMIIHYTDGLDIQDLQEKFPNWKFMIHDQLYMDC